MSTRRWGVDLGDGIASLPRARSARVEVPATLLADGLAALAGAASRVDAADAALPLLAARPGVRAVAVLVRSGRRAVVVGSAGYDCGTMAPGADLPLDAGLPVTEAVRTGRTVVQGDGPAWVALPFGRGRREPGALLLSLTDGPPEAPEDLERLHRLADAVGDALHRTEKTDAARAALDVVRTSLRPAAVDGSPRLEVLTRAVCGQDDVSGDVVLRLPDGRGGDWLLAADVAGSGLSAALVARGVRAAARAAAGWASGPAALLAAVEQGLADDVPPGSFVTALAVSVGRDDVRWASAGHPSPVLLAGGTAAALEVDPDPPLLCGAQNWREATAELPDGATLLLHTDGLVERRTDDGVRLLDAVDLAVGLPRDLALAADRLLAAAEAAGPSPDDVSLLLARRR